MTIIKRTLRMYNSLTGKKKLVCEQDIMESITLIWD